MACEAGHRYISNKDQTAVAISASVAKPSSAIFANTPDPHTGFGVARLSGPYTGADDATIEVEITNDVGTNPRVTEPVFRGVGNGTFNGLTVDPGASAQDYTFTLIDLGQDILTARLELDTGQILESTVTGDAGNATTITVDESALVVGDPVASLPDAWTGGADSQAGDKWNFGAVPLTADGKIPSDAPRFRIGYDPTVYVHYSAVEDGETRYFLSPAPADDLPEQSPVRPVTGTYTVTVQRGATTRTYPLIRTRFGWLNEQQNDNQRLLQAITPIVRDTAPGGIGAMDLNLRTLSYIESVESDSSIPVPDDLSVSTSAATQLISVIARDVEIPGLEQYDVVSSVTGSLGIARAGQSFTSSVVDFTMPAPSVSAVNPANCSIPKLISQDYQSDPETGRPVACLSRQVLGANARSKIFTLTYTAKPAAECECDPSASQGVPRLQCLGLDSLPGEVSTVATLIEADIAAKWKEVSDWYASMVSTNIVLEPSNADPNLFSVAGTTVEINFYKYARDTFYKALGAATGVPALITSVSTAIDSVMADSEVDKFDGAGAYLANSGVATTLRDRVIAPLAAAFVDEGYQSPFEDASGTDPCWQDLDDRTHYWAVVDDNGNIYKPCYHNSPNGYHTCIDSIDPETGEDIVVSTKEAFWNLNVGCESYLTEGDELQIQIKAGADADVVENNASLDIQIIGAAAIRPSGGQNGDNTHTWKVEGSVDGVIDEYEVIDGAETPFTLAGQFSATLTRGAIANVLGDRWAFSVERARWRSRRDGGAWSAPADLPDEGSTAALADGLAVEFVRGAAPSFPAGDRYSWRVEQPASPSNALTPGEDRYRSGPAAAWSIEADTASATTPTVVVIGPHTIPAGATLQLVGADVPGGAGDTYALTWQADLIVAYLDGVTARRYWRLEAASAPDASVQWFYVGPDVMLSVQAEQVDLYDEADMSGEDSALMVGYATGADVGLSFLSTDDMSKLRAMHLHAKQTLDEPIAFVPNYRFPAEAFMARMPDRLPRGDRRQYHPADLADRRLTSTLALEPYFARE